MALRVGNSSPSGRLGGANNHHPPLFNNILKESKGIKIG